MSIVSAPSIVSARALSSAIIRCLGRHRLLRGGKHALHIRAISGNMPRELTRRDDKLHSSSLGDSCSHQAAQRKRDRLARCTHHFAQQAMVLQLEPQVSVVSDEGSIGGKSLERSDETLLHIL